MRTSFLGGGGGIGNLVTSVFGRIGAVVATAGDYAASLVTNDSSVSGATVKAALNTLLAAIPSIPVTSVFTRTGAIVAALNDYAASLVSNDSSVSGATVKDALNALKASAANSFQFSWGSSAAAAATTQKYLSRLNATLASSTLSGDYPAPATGTFLFTVTWRAGVPLTTNTVTIDIWKNGVVTSITSTIPANTVSGQFSGSLAVVAGDGISIGTKQSGTEAQSSWLLVATLTGTI